MKATSKKSISFNDEVREEFAATIPQAVLDAIPRAGQRIHIIVPTEGEDETETGERIINNPELTVFYRTLSYPVRITSFIEEDTVLLINGEIRMPLTKEWNRLSVMDRIFTDKAEALSMMKELNLAQEKKIEDLINALTGMKGFLEKYREKECIN